MRLFTWDLKNLRFLRAIFFFRWRVFSTSIFFFAFKQNHRYTCYLCSTTRQDGARAVCVAPYLLPLAFGAFSCRARSQRFPTSQYVNFFPWSSFASPSFSRYRFRYTAGLRSRDRFGVANKQFYSSTHKLVANSLVAAGPPFFLENPDRACRDRGNNLGLLAYGAPSYRCISVPPGVSASIGSEEPGSLQFAQFYISSLCN